MSNHILMVADGGRGETPVPADALMQPGEIIGVHRPDGSAVEAKVVAVVPPRYPIEWAVADQNGQPRPIMLRDNRRRQNLYVFDVDGVELLVPHDKLRAAKARADRAGLNGEAAK